MSVAEPRDASLLPSPRPTVVGLPISTEYSAGFVLPPSHRRAPPAPVAAGPSRLVKTVKSRKGTWAASGAAAWVLDGDEQLVPEAERHHVDAGGPSWRAETDAFDVLVHSAATRTGGRSGSYTVFSVTSYFADGRAPVTVVRRFSHFLPIQAVLARRFSALVLPKLPTKKLIGRMSAEFVETRRRDLQRWLSRVVRHPIVRSAAAVQAFLTLDEEAVRRPSKV